MVLELANDLGRYLSEWVYDTFFFVNVLLNGSAIGWITTKIFESNMGGQPIFPPELERKIFELLVKDHPKSALPLMLVAARTHHWYTSRYIYYHTILISSILVGLYLRYTAYPINLARPIHLRGHQNRVSSTTVLM